MSWEARFTPLAQDDVTEAYADYEAARGGLGAEFLAEVGRAVGVISDFPEACPEVHRGVRRALVHRFPYSLYYRLVREAELVEIRAVVHQRRHPRAGRRRA